MSLHPQQNYIVPAETANVAKAIFPTGNLCITMADCLHSFICDQDFSALFYPHLVQAGLVLASAAMA